MHQCRIAKYNMHPNVTAHGQENKSAFRIL
ncbi:hypothetical protein NHJ6243_010191, partial [Beauveria neobassiana]